ncbi:unnamed protein product [Bursaphelenchus okinawaensis]|uniref:Replication protein A C-terminal domain-containing protein n=1 Tax=Bursaphelenchus okinawaensis TaxID=465554 RepID=A0A811K857_9BILA|nr:unnamed protein product [Bursaphelenchus okinawaensis]CAG9093635.1 unnamed protein product [Bursaphelenchus okinawaensis]
MDVSFEPTMAGGGWGADVGNVSMTQAPAASSGQFEKIPLPVLLKDASNCMSDDDKYHVGSYGFVNIKVIGRIESIEETSTAERWIILTDVKDESVKLKVSLYDAVQSKTEPYAEGDIVLILGKIRLFDNEISMLAFHLQVVKDMKRVECFLAEAALAYGYFNQNLPERISNDIAVELNGTIFSNAPVETKGKQSQVTAKAGSSSGADTTLNSRGLAGVQAKIHSVISKLGGDSGVHLDEVKKHVGNVPKFDDEIQHLVNEGVIYSTIDDFHYSAL